LLPEPGAIYVMDRGYIDFDRLGRFHEAGSFFVIRAKTNLKTERRYSHVVDRSTGLVCDQTRHAHRVLLAQGLPADAYTLPDQRVERLLTTTGDLGTVAETLAATKRGPATSILYVFDELRYIARIAGKGSQTEKCTRVAR
jgi:hypothetical protein